jgi:hypothetical protein
MASLTTRLESIRATAMAKAELCGERLPNAQPPELYAAIQQTVFASDVPAKAIADAAGLTYQALTDLANDSRGKQLKAHHVPALVNTSGCDAILRWLAAECGCVVVKLPDATRAAHVAIVAQAARVMREVAEAIEVLGSALADGRLTVEERADVERQIADAHRELAALQLHVDRSVEVAA